MTSVENELHAKMSRLEQERMVRLFIICLYTYILYLTYCVLLSELVRCFFFIYLFIPGINAGTNINVKDCTDKFYWKLLFMLLYFRQQCQMF